MTPSLHITGDDAADRLLSTDPLALLIGMLLDQQIAMETAFAGPEKLRARFGSLDAAALAGADAGDLEELFRQTPAIHRYPGSMAQRTQALCAAVVADWGGDAAAIWTRPGDGGAEPTGTEVLRRLKALPGYGDQKARILLSLLGKQYGVTPEGWRTAAGAYGEEGSFRSVADIVDAESLARVRETKRAAKAAAKTGTGG